MVFERFSDQARQVVVLAAGAARAHAAPAPPARTSTPPVHDRITDALEQPE